MSEFLQGLIHDRNEIIKKGKCNFSKTQATYKLISKKVKKELMNIKETEYNKEGFNMLRMLINYKDNVMLFTNSLIFLITSNLAERGLRISKTKMKISGINVNIRVSNRECGHVC